MAEERVQRRLAAILAADVVGYSRLMGADEAGTLARLKQLRHDVFDPHTEKFGGRLFKTTGDGLLVEFPSAVDAVNHAVAVQRALAAANADVSDNQQLIFRIGISLGDVIVDGDDLYGNGVNVAARMEGLAEPGGICVSGNVFEHVETAVDVVFDDLGPQEVKNIAHPVRSYRVHQHDHHVAPIVSGDQPLAPPEKPSIAVLPFENLSGDPEQEYFSDGITEDIISALSHIRQFFVIARNTTFTYKGQAVDVRTVAKEMGVRYVLEGSVRKAGNRVRITAQLIDGDTGNHLWAERYDRELKDVFEVQDEITLTVVGAIEPELGRAEQQRALQKIPDNLDAWDIYQRGKEQYYHFSEEGAAKALEYYQQAIDLEPNFAHSFAAIAYNCHRQLLVGYSDSPDETLKLGLSSGLKAVELDSGDAESQAALGAIFWSANEFTEAVSVLETAVQLNPSSAFAHSVLGMAMGAAGQAEEGIEHHLTAMLHSPRDPDLWVMMARCAYCHVIARKHEKAFEWGKKAIRNSNYRMWITFPAPTAALAYLEKVDEARQLADQMLELKPDASIKLIRAILKFGNSEDQEHYLDGLRMAGVPEN